MNAEAQRVAIAKYLGWKKDYRCVDHNENEIIAWRAPDGRGPFDEYYIPDFCNDLNAMHEAEKAMIYEQRPIFAEALNKITRTAYLSKTHWSGYEHHATAAQRAQAFLRALSLWKSDPA